MPATYSFKGLTKLLIRNNESMPGISMDSTLMEVTEAKSSITLGTDFKPGTVVFILPLTLGKVQDDGSIKANVDGSGSTITLSAGDAKGIMGLVLNQTIA